MDFGLIALVLLVSSKVLDYVAPKTKTKIDDKARDLVHWAIPLLPAAKDAKAVRETGGTVEGTQRPQPPAAITGFKVRDHR